MALHSSLNEASKLAVAAVFKVGVPAPGLSPTTGNGVARAAAPRVPGPSVGPRGGGLGRATLTVYTKTVYTHTDAWPKTL